MSDIQVSKSWVISAAFLLVVVSLGVGAMVVRFFSPAPPTTVSEVASSQTDSQNSVEADSKGEAAADECKFEGLDLMKIPEAGFVTDWKPWGQRLKLPYSPHGAKIYEGVPHCFAPSPEGAVLAAGNYAILATAGEKELEVTEQYIYPNEFSKLALAEVRARSERLSPPIELKGWHIEGIGENHVVVYVAFTRPDMPRRLISWGMEMKYHNGDWKFVGKENLQSTFNEIFSVEQSGYKRW